eukprot:3941955-Rhodomonas_salina.2
MLLRLPRTNPGVRYYQARRGTYNQGRWTGSLRRSALTRSVMRPFLRPIRLLFVAPYSRFRSTIHPPSVARYGRSS